MKKIINKKIKGAQKVKIDGHEFKSRLEMHTYLLMKEAKLPFGYENETFVLMKGNVTDVKTIVDGKFKRFNKMRDITYTPDFIVNTEFSKWFIDVKGFPNDVYPLKKKMFLTYLSQGIHGKHYYFIEPHTLKEVREMINLIIDTIKKEGLYDTVEINGVKKIIR